jgi:hypothetical protein
VRPGGCHDRRCRSPVRGFAHRDPALRGKSIGHHHQCHHFVGDPLRDGDQRACRPAHEWVTKRLSIRWIVVCGSGAARIVVECLGGEPIPAETPIEAGWSTFRLATYVVEDKIVLALPTFTRGWDPTDCSEDRSFKMRSREVP